MGNYGAVEREPVTLARAVNGVFSGTDDMFRLAERLVDIAERLSEASPERRDLVEIATQLSSTAVRIAQNQQSAVNAISRVRTL